MIEMNESIPKKILKKTAILWQDKRIQDDYFHTNQIYCMTAGLLICMLGLIGMVGTNAPLKDEVILSNLGVTSVYGVFFAFNLIFLLLFFLEQKRVLKEPEKYWRVLIPCFVGSNMILTCLTFYTTQNGSSFFFEYILVTSIIYMLPNLDVPLFLIGLTCNLLGVRMVLYTMNYSFVWQDLTDMVVLHVMCGFVTLVRWKAFLNHEKVKFSIVEEKEKLYISSRTDELTGLLNRTALRQDYPEYLNRDVCVALIDVDVFKNINDTYGHTFGDQVLKKVSAVLKATFSRNGERCYRYGGDEFLVLSPETDAPRFVRRLMLAHGLNAGKLQAAHISTSVGYSRGLANSTDELRTLIRIADSYLYQAKEGGAGEIKGSIERTDRQMPVSLARQLTDLDQLSNTDEISRLFFEKELNAKDWSVIYLNINQYSEINESFGYRKGREVLEKCSRIIRAAFPDSAIANREVDHFILYSTLGERECIRNIRVIQSKVIKIEPEHPIIIRAGLFHHADSAPPMDFVAGMFRAKYASDAARDSSRGDREFCLYTEDMEEEHKKGLFVHDNFLKALKESCIVPYYQPIVGSISKTTCGFEALSRWIDPKQGLLPPGDYIPYLEKARVAYKLDLYLLEKVCQDISGHREAFPEKLFININLSQSDFEVTDMPAAIDGIVTRYRIPKSQIQFEITESAFAEVRFIRNAVSQLRELGYKIWMDDFGVGESSLSAFHMYDVDGVKLDQSFFAHVNQSRAQIIIRNIVDLSHETNCMMAAEGIENLEQLWLAREWGINFIQGFYFSRPLPLEELLRTSFVKNVTNARTDHFYQMVAEVYLGNDFLGKYRYFTDNSFWGARGILELDRKLYILRETPEMYRFTQDVIQTNGSERTFREDAELTLSLMKAAREVRTEKSTQRFEIVKNGRRFYCWLLYLTENPDCGKTAFILNITNFAINQPENKQMDPSGGRNIEREKPHS